MDMIEPQSTQRAQRKRSKIKKFNLQILNPYNLCVLPACHLAGRCDLCGKRCCVW